MVATTEDLVYQRYDPGEYSEKLMRSSQRRHRKIFSLSFSVNGSLLAAGYSLGLVAIWNVVNAVMGKENSLHAIATFSACSCPVYSIQMTDDLIICGTDNGIRAFRLADILTQGITEETPQVVFDWQTTSGGNFEVNGLAVSDDMLYAACGDNNAYSIDLATGHTVSTFRGHEDYLHCAVLRKCGELATGSEDATVKFWDSRTTECTNTLHCPAAQGTYTPRPAANLNDRSKTAQNLAPPTTNTRRLPASPSPFTASNVTGSSSKASDNTRGSSKGSSKSQTTTRQRDLQIVGKQWVSSLAFDESDTWMAMGALQGPFLFHLPTQQLLPATKPVPLTLVARAVAIVENEICVGSSNGRHGMMRWNMKGEQMTPTPTSCTVQHAIAVSPGLAKVVAIAGEGSGVDILVNRNFKSFTLTLN